MSAVPRGEYRSMYTVILDTEDYVALSNSAKHLLLTLKIALPWSGIAVLTPAVIAEQLGGMDHLDYVRGALAELEATGWVKREKNVLWLVNGLRYEPSISVRDVKHRRGVQRRVASLPKCALVGEFKRYYADWFSEEVAPNAVSVPAPDGGNGKASAQGQGSSLQGPSKGQGRAPVHATASVQDSVSAQDSATATAFATLNSRTTTTLTKRDRQRLSTFAAHGKFDSAIVDAYFAAHPDELAEIQRAESVGDPDQWGPGRQALFASAVERAKQERYCERLVEQQGGLT